MSSAACLAANTNTHREAELAAVEDLALGRAATLREGKGLRSSAVVCTGETTGQTWGRHVGGAD